MTRMQRISADLSKKSVEIRSSVSSVSYGSVDSGETKCPSFS